jgi:glycosyltransferase involved in cell wall biosynthesis
VGEPLDVLHLYAGNLYGGVERMLAVLATTPVAGMEPRFALAFEGRLARELGAGGAEVALLGGARLSRPWTVARARRRLGELVLRRAPAVVVCHSTWVHALFAPVVRNAGVPLAFWLHDAVRGRGWADRLARRTPPDRALCTSAFAAASLARLWPHLPGEVVYPPVPQPDATTPARPLTRLALGTPEDAVVVLQASRMEAWKGHRVLIEALARLAHLPGWSCWIAGGAARPHERRHLAAMRTLAHRRGIGPRVRFLGERDDVPALMAAADLFCQPNLQAEPFGIAFVEAMHAGLPVVGAALGGSREVVDAATGVLVPPGDAEALATALAGLVENGAKRARLGAAGPARARLLAEPRRQAERVAVLLRELVEERRG